MIQDKDVLEELKKVMDPEIGCSIVDLGLIYKIAIDKEKEKVDIDMTLTTPGCPLVEMIGEDVEKAVKKVKGVKEVKVNMVFEPVWTPERMTDKLKKKMGF